MNQRKTTARHSGNRGGALALLRLNLAPVMGRRNAAYDAAASAIADGLTPVNASELLKIVSGAERDSSALLSMLSSPATIEREQTMLGHIRKVRCLLELLGCWRDAAGRGESAASPESGWDPAMEPVVRKIFDLLRTAGPRITSYRSYATKSSSASHAEHYRKAYSFYLEIYKSRLAAPKTGKCEQ